MPLINKNWKYATINDDVVILEKEYLENNSKLFKKITGTRFAAVLGLNKYNSEFKTWMMMTNLFKDEMDPTLSLVGNIIEPKIKDYVSEKTGINYISYDPKKIGFDLFKDNKIFGGIPDGEPSTNGISANYSNNDPMLEIKTSSIDSFVYRTSDGQMTMKKDENGLPQVKEKGGKMATWFSNDKIKIPEEYACQICLYMYLKNVKRGLFAVGFLEKEDYKNPENFDANKHKIFLEEIEFDRDLFSKYVAKAEEWYKKYIVNGKSPKMNPDDKKWLHEYVNLLNK